MITLKKFLLASSCLLISFCLNAQWQPTNGPCGGRITCSLVKNQYVFAGTEDHGIFVSTDNGNTWTARNNGLVNMKIHKLCLHGSKMFAATFAGLFESDDNGNTWNTVIINGFAAIEIYSVASNNQAIFIAIPDSLMRSTDNGVTWNTVLSDVNPYYTSSIAVNGMEVYMGVYDYGIYKSTDNGNTFDWIDLTAQGVGAFSSFLFIGSKILATASETYTSGLIYESTDGGYNWFPSIGGFSYYGAGILASDGSRIYAGMWNESMDPDRGGIYYSEDSGENWSYLGMKGYSVRTLAFSGNRFIAGTSPGGVFSSDNSGVSWHETSTGLARLTTGAITLNGSTIFAATNEVILKSTDKGNTWVHVNKGLPPFENIYALACNNSVLFAGSYKIYRSLNNGNNWEPMFDPGYPVTCFAFLGSRIFAGTQTNYYPYGGGGIFLSEDLGVTWKAVNNGLLNTTIFSLAANGMEIYAGTDNGIFVSSNYGSNWTPVNNGLTYLHVPAIGTNENYLFVSAYHNSMGWNNPAAIFYSENKGENWTKSRLEYQNNSYSSSFVADGGKVITGVIYGDVQAYLTDDNGLTWSAVNSGLPYETGIQSLAIIDSTVYASVISYYSSEGILGYGIWKRPLSEITAFRLSPDTLVLGRDAGSTTTLSILSSTPWTIEEILPDWLSASKFSGEGSDQVIFTASEANPYQFPRYFSTEVISSGISRHFTIVQDGKLLGTDGNDSEHFRIYPNPTSGSIVIESVAQNNRLTIYNSLGKVLSEQPVTSSKILLNLSSYGRGVYFIRLSGDKGSSISNIVVW